MSNDILFYFVLMISCIVWLVAGRGSDRKTNAMS